MTEEKKFKNPFVNMANQAKKNNPINNVPQKAPKPTKGFGGSAPVRRSGRGR